MSSKWNPRTKKRNTPPWCYPGLFPILPPIVDGRPSYLTVYLHWTDTDPAIDAEETATIKMPWSAEDEKWSAHQSGDRLNLGGSVIPQEQNGLFTCELDLYWNDELSEAHEWYDVRLGPDFPWDSGLLEIQLPVPSPDQSMHVYG